MNSLSQHIEQLIIQHDCVIVPGLGGFITYREAAHVVGNTIYPPTKKVRFNHLLNYNDGLLCEKYMTSLRISYTESLDRITADVNEITSIIHHKGHYTLGQIGEMRLHNNGTIWLECSNATFIPDNYGLRAVNLAHQIAAHSDDEQKTIVIKLPHTSANILRYAAAIAIVSLITLLIPQQISDTKYSASIGFDTIRNISNSTTMHNIAIIENNHTTLAQQIDTPIINVDEVAVTEPIAEPTKSISEPIAEVQASSTQTTGRYHIIIASLANEEKAQQYIATQTHYNANELQIISTNNKHRISARRFATYKEATTYVDSIRATEQGRQAWVLCKK